MGSIRIVRSVSVIWFGMCFLKATAEDLCAATFPSVDDVHNTLQDAVVPEQIQNNLVIQWVFPSMTFGCNGNITRWIFQAQKNNNSKILPKFQLWRKRSVTPNDGNFLLELMKTSGSEEELSGGEGPVYEYILQSQLEVRAGYMFGIHLPLRTNNEQLRVKFLDMSEGGTPTSYFRDFDGNTFDTRSSSHNDQSYVPLVAAEISLPSSMTTVVFSPTPLSTQTVSNPTLEITPGSSPLGDPAPTTSKKLPTTFIMVGATVVGGLSALVMVTVLIVLLVRYIQAKRNHSNNDNQTSADSIQIGPNEAYGTIRTTWNTAYESTVPPHNKDNYSYPLTVREERYIESSGTGIYDYCRPTC